MGNNFVFLLVLFSISFNAITQDFYKSRYEAYPDPKRFSNEIESQLKEAPFKKSDRELIVFTGSSSIRFWMNLKDDFIEYDVLNRGFGGSIFSDLNFFIEDLVI